MTTATPSELMTIEAFLALPEDGMRRELIRGELREKEMPRRNRWHSSVESRVVAALSVWLDTQPEPRGLIVSGEAGFILQRDPDSGVGIDVAYVSAEVTARDPEGAYFEGPPVLAVEILSPSDTQQEIDEKIVLYLETGVARVWIINPRFKTVTVYRPDAPPEQFNETHELTAEPLLPRFQVPVASLF
ncbi:Uma2 family endonuclease [Tautonia rosea]|uniref:Uma2 family endonuclease n=1 Tax=Tautonia rosea TaxID=2728037 RepID=UPI001474E7D9|nr:Uma2 family endonuclease [Tautonia rosea]